MVFLQVVVFTYGYVLPDNFISVVINPSLDLVYRMQTNISTAVGTQDHAFQKSGSEIFQINIQLVLHLLWAERTFFPVIPQVAADQTPFTGSSGNHAVKILFNPV
jgi:hypothetical protein